MGFDHKTDHGYSASGTSDSEFSWGPGPVPPGAELKPPSEGGQYAGRSPDMTEPERRYRRSGAPRGYPGDPVAR